MKPPLWTYYVRGAMYTLASIISGARELNFDAGYGYSSRAAKSARAVLPYALNPVRDDTDPLLIWVNRDYKPLGVLPYGQWVDYADFPHLHAPRDEPMISRLLRECKHHGGNCYLFDDLTDPCGGKVEARRLLRLLELIGLPKETA